MHLSLAEYLAAVPDLEFPQALHRVGTCPACGNYGMVLKHLDLDKAKGISPFNRVYEPYCPAGCSLDLINAGCNQLLLESTSTGL